jgi:protein-disulfide isomerase
MFKWLGSVLAFLFIAVAIPAQAQLGEPDPTEIEKEDFFKEGLAPVRKNAGYDVTIVYFMDYQCPACRRYTPDVAKVFGEDRKLRVIYRDTPIFGPRSEAAARAAIASQFQGKHEAFHHALMTTKLPLDEEALRAAAKKAGVDWQRLQADLEKHHAEIDRQIATNTALSSATGISGTPAFIVGDGLVDGAIDYKGLTAEIADARKAMGKAAPVLQPAEKAASPEAAEIGPKDEVATKQAAAADEAPVFDRSTTPSQLDEPVSEAEPSATPASWPAWIAGIAVLLAASAGWLAYRRRRKSAGQ